MRRFGELEALIMDRLWEQGRPMLVREMVEGLRDDRPLAYTTVMTVMENLHRKGWLRRERDGRAWRYEPTGSRSGYTAALMNDALATSPDRRTALANLQEAERDFFVRQLWDWKASVDLDTILPQGLELYGQVCGFLLARAHACSGDRIAIASYLGQGDTFDRALAEFAVAYADQNERDHAALRKAADEGRIPVQEGL